MHDVAALNRRSACPTAKRQPLPVRAGRAAKPAGLEAGVFLAVSLVVGLAISVAILAAAGIAPIELAGELAGVFNGDSLRGVLVQAVA